MISSVVTFGFPPGGPPSIPTLGFSVGSSPPPTPMALPDLITAGYASAGLAAAQLSAAQIAFQPYAISAASNEIRRWCMDRDFTQGTYTEIYPVALDGYIRLNQIPVNQILRVQCQPQTACSIVNTDPSVQYAQALFAYTGDVATGQTVTGLMLNWTSNGTPSTTTILFTTGMTINALAVLVNAVGSGWSASPDSILGAWPVTQIFTGWIGEGATTQSSPGTCELLVFSQDLVNARFHPDDGQKTGLVWVGQRYPGLGPSWGLDWSWWDNASSGGTGVVQVTYNAGFAAIPDIVQLACVEGVKVILQRMKINPYLESESAGEYAYKLAFNMMQALPTYVIQELSSYRLINA